MHLGTGKELLILDLAKLIKKLFGDEIKISFAPKRKGEIKRNYSDITKAKNVLGFSPQVSIKDGVKSVYNWFKTVSEDDMRETMILSGSE